MTADNTQARRIVQIAVAAGDTKDFLYGLCNDGTIWVTVYPEGYSESWHQLAPIPQPGQEDA